MRDAILITGGAGFIGCHVARALAGSDLAIVALDNLHPQVHRERTRPAALPDAVDLVVGDVTSSASWAELLARYHPRIVVHLAAETGTAQSLTQSSRHGLVNVVGTTMMLDALHEAAMVPDHVLLASSRAVYGEGAWRDANGLIFHPGPRDHARLVAGAWDFDGPGGAAAEAMPNRAATTRPNPSSIYAATKLAQEHILSSWCSAKGAPLSILRFQNVYGPGQSPFNPYTGIITLFHRLANANQVIDVYEDGLMGRDFVYIDTAVAACSSALMTPAPHIRTLDVGSGTTTTILEAACIVAAAYGAPKPVISGRFRDGDVRSATADTIDVANVLGPLPRMDFATGSRRVGQWMLQNGELAGAQSGFTG